MAPSTGGSEGVQAIIFDLDGTIIDTESLVLEVVRCVIESHGKTLTAEAATQALGMRPAEAWEAVARTLGIPASGQQLYEQSEPLLQDRWHEAPLLPGVARLIAHLSMHSIPLALATSTPRATLERKLSSKDAMRAAFRPHLCVCGDEVQNGKPAPDCFMAVAQRLGLPPSACLVIEDAPAGVAAATAAGMRVVAVPSILQKGGQPSDMYPAPDPAAAAGCVSILPSLLEFRPEQYGLPPFEDRIGETIPMHPVLHLRGTVVPGFGRGSRELGIPTANLDADSLRGALAEAVTGIFAGWATLPHAYSTQVFPMCMSIGFNPVFKNAEKTAEPWILHDFGPGANFCGQEIRLIVCAFIRPEANFESLQALIDRIHRDGEVSKEALAHPAYQQQKENPFLFPAAGNGAAGSCAADGGAAAGTEPQKQAGRRGRQLCLGS